MKIFIKIKTRDKIKCSQKNFKGGRRVILWGEINPGKYLTGKLTPGNFSPSPKEKERKKKEN